MGQASPFPGRGADSLQGQSAVVAGGSRGLGLLLADRLAARGCAVTLAARDGAELDRARAKLLQRQPGATVRTAVCDLRAQADVRDLFAATGEACGGVDLVIANAGIIQVAPLESLDAADFDDAMRSIFHSALHTSLEALPYLRESPGGGRLALISSVGGLLGVPHLLPYACAKSAVGTLAEGLRAETSGTGVSVTAVYPGLMRTGSHLHAMFGGAQRQEYGWFSTVASTPLVSMSARHAAERIVRATVRRRARLVLTPAARAADLAHGIAPAATTRLSGVAARLLPRAPVHARGMREGKDIDPPRGAVTRTVQRAGSALNERAADAYNERDGDTRKR
ncbi:SDR family oxidoreductase [Streptomyces sp. G44]|uniref:SDR family NAD(P)-dependent oxidoreductase n=1 Tax=Streptomyces sp. G44 TaxID=2807632 RepID=UPI00196051A7|nr:SDR family oxidoreductase [Streptomyces sp. G44]MBM7166837.1 SDR family oxidoreductase [Streptomyces sp. G44]